MQGDGLCNNITDADAISFNLYYNFFVLPCAIVYHDVRE